MKKVIIIVSVVCLIVAGVWFIRQQQEPAELLGATLLPANTILYSGCQTTLKTRAALSLADFEKELESLGFDAKESQKLDAWLSRVKSAHVGLMSFSLIPFSLDAAIILQGDFDAGLVSVLPATVASEFQQAIPYREVAVHTMAIPLNQMFQLELFITEPVQGITLITLSRPALNSTVDRLLDGGPSIADHPDYMELTALPEIRNKDIVTYMDVKAYIETVFGFLRMVPVPAAQQLPNILREELRLDEWGPVITGQSLLKTGYSVSYSKFPLDMPLYQQMEATRPVDFSGIPSDVYQVSMMQLADPALARQQLTELANRLFVRVGPLFPRMPVLDNPVAMAELLLGFSLSEIDPLLSGEVGMWQTINPDLPEGSAQTYCIGITDAGAVRKFIAERVLGRIGQAPVEENGLFTLDLFPQIAWAIQSNRLLISNDPRTLSAQLQADAFLVDSPVYIALRKQLPDNLASIQYSDYTDIQKIYSAQSERFPPQVDAFFELLEGMITIQGGVAENGLIRSVNIVNCDISGDDIREVFHSIFDLLDQ